MRKSICIISLLLCAFLLSSVTAGAAGVEIAPSDEVCAVVSLSDGGESVVVDGAPTAALMSRADSYELYVYEEPVLSVERVLAGVGAPGEPSGDERFYSVDFTFADTETEVFLTGLRAEYVEQIQQYIIENYTEGANFDMTDLGFIDAEKTYRYGDGDDNLCWAASCSDILIYTGWAAAAGFDSGEDDLFETFITAFRDGGGHPYTGLAWFFNGAALGDNSDEYSANIKDYPNSGGYLNSYAFDTLAVNGGLYAEDMDTAAGYLRSGCGVSIAVEIYENGENYGGHAITMWGFIVDNSLGEGDPERYKAVFVTDSDSYEGATADSDRRDADNVMHLLALSVTDRGEYRFDYDDKTSAVIFDFTALMPYSDDIDTESDPDASGNKTADPDLAIGDVFITDNGSTRELKTLFETGSDVSVSYKVRNFADVRYSGYIYPRVTVTDARGSVVFDRTQVFNVNISPFGVSVPTFVTVEDIPAGEYTLTCTLNPDHSADKLVAEAFYINNTRTVSFTVRDFRYVLGDYDGDGVIQILDATKIQRYLADLYTPADDNAGLRGDVNGEGLNITDVTLIQRYLADLSVDYPIGETFMYNDTEA